MFWVFLVVGLILPIIILLIWKDLAWLRAAAALAILGVLAEKLWLLTAGQTFPWIFLPEGFYVPAWSEWLGLIGAIALIALLYLGVSRLTRAD